jgi:hypothetical protein
MVRRAGARLLQVLPYLYPPAPTPSTRDGVQGHNWAVGQTRRRVWIADDWRVLDVGSGHRPLARADVLLERFPEDDAERAGVATVRNPKLVIGDAQAMPFEDGAFDYAVASHVAGYVEDPQLLCRELTRVARAGYIETPGRLGDVLLGEPFVRWRVRRRGPGLLEFRAKSELRPFGLVNDVFYALVYMGIERPGRRTWVPRSRSGRAVAKICRYLMAVAIQAPPIRSAFYMQFEWRGAVESVVVR